MSLKLPRKKFWLLVSPLLLLVVLGLIFISVVAAYQIDGISMLPTFDNNAKVRGLKIFGELKRGDLVTYALPNEHCESVETCIFFGRVIGLPGEKIEMANYFVKINDQQIEEPYLAPDTKTLFSPEVGGIFELKDDEYFVMGDNRPYSADSRLFGPVKREQIKAKIILMKNVLSM